MSSPQIEQGYTRIANELFLAIMRTRMPAESRSVLDAIIRKTYGFGKKVDTISASQIAAMTVRRAPNVRRALAWLKASKIITRDDEGRTGVQKDYSKWKPPLARPRAPLSALSPPLRVELSPPLGIELPPPLRVDTHNRKGKRKVKEKNTDDGSAASVPGVENKVRKADPIVEVFDTFHRITGWIPGYGNKTERAAAAGLLKDMSLAEIAVLLRRCQDARHEQFFPQVNKPSHLADKLPSVRKALGPEVTYYNPNYSGDDPDPEETPDHEPFPS